MGKKGRKKKDIIPLELVQYPQYQKYISFARERLLCQRGITALL
jgi:hypothetical protein